MKEIEIYKAQKINNEIESINIIIDEEVPNITYDPSLESTIKLIKKCDDLYNEQAEKLSNALTNSLPGGVIDRLLICLLEHKKSILKVKY